MPVSLAIPRLVDYQLKSIGQGEDAQGEATVKIAAPTTNAEAPEIFTYDVNQMYAERPDGTLVVARANPQKYEEVRRYQIAQSAVWAHPAITSTSIIVKDVDKVICWSF